MSGMLTWTWCSGKAWGAVLVMGIPAIAADLVGWEGMRVIEQMGRPSILKSADLDGDGRDELIVVNSQFSRLDIYRWLLPEARQLAEKNWKEGINDLPMAGDCKRDEVQLEHVPHDVIVRTREGTSPELLVLVSPPNRVISYTWQDNAWTVGQRYLLPPGELAPRHKPLLSRPSSGDSMSLLIGYENGIHVLDLQQPGKADWLSPREARDRLDWWLADLDGDGDNDLLELGREADESLRWYETVATGHLASAAVLFDQALSGAGVLRRANRAAQPLAIDGDSTGLLRRYELMKSAQHPVGDRYPLALGGGTETHLVRSATRRPTRIGGGRS